MAIQDKFNKSNVIYKITKDIDLDGGTLTIPVGCTLDFQGGSLVNGTVSFNNTNITGVPKFVTVTVSGTIVNGEIELDWFITDYSTDCAAIITNIATLNNGSITVRLGPRTYIVNSTVQLSYGNSLIGSGSNSTTINSNVTDIAIQFTGAAAQYNNIVSGFLLNNVGTDKVGTGIKLLRDNFANVNNIKVYSFEIGIDIDNSISACVQNCYLLSNATGVKIHSISGNSTVKECIINSSSICGINADSTQVRIDDCDIEGTGVLVNNKYTGGTAIIATRGARVTKCYIERTDVGIGAGYGGINVQQCYIAVREYGIKNLVTDGLNLGYFFIMNNNFVSEGDNLVDIELMGCQLIAQVFNIGYVGVTGAYRTMVIHVSPNTGVDLAFTYLESIGNIFNITQSSQVNINGKAIQVAT